jgi:CheY-like chemotaxis protein
MPLQRILVLDNDPTAALITQRGLQRLLHDEAEIMIASSPGTAWSQCAQEEVDLLIVDPGPQNQAAAGLIKALHDDRPQPPVLVLTAYDTPYLRARMRALGVQHYLAKPIELLDLERSVRVALGLASSSGSG